MDTDAEVGAVAARRSAFRAGDGQAPKTLLIIYHSQTGGTLQMAEAAARGAAAADDGDVSALVVRLLPAAEAVAADVLGCHGMVFATPEYLGTMSGLLKDFFDRTYYAVLDRVTGLPYAALVCAGSDGAGAVRQIERIATGWRLRAVAAPLVVCTRAQTSEAILRTKVIPAQELDRCRELGGALAAGLLLGVF